MTLCSTHNTETEIQKNVQIASHFLKLCKHNGIYKARHVPKIKQNVAIVDHVDRLQNIDVLRSCGKTISFKTVY